MAVQAYIVVSIEITRMLEDDLGILADNITLLLGNGQGQIGIMFRLILCKLREKKIYFGLFRTPK